MRGSGGTAKEIERAQGFEKAVDTVLMNEFLKNNFKILI